MTDDCNSKISDSLSSEEAQAVSLEAFSSIAQTLLMNSAIGSVLAGMYVDAKYGTDFGPNTARLLAAIEREIRDRKVDKV